MPVNQHAETPLPTYRSGAVARLTGIPVETLRVWERRYKLVGPRQSATGQRLYSEEEVARLTIIKQLVDSGHAIGSIATLKSEQLKAMLDKAARATPRPAGVIAERFTPPLRLAVVGLALGLRLERHSLPALQIVATSPNVAHAIETLLDTTADILIVGLPTLQSETAQAIRSLAQQLGARRIVVEYGFGSTRVEQELRAAGCRLVRAPINMDQVQSLCRVSAAAPQTSTNIPAAQIDTVAPRRFDNKTLAEIAMTSVVLNCECPHHIVDLLVQMGNFETYSAECKNRSPADAALHQYLEQVAGNARILLETALERVAEAEGIALPERTT
jgi:MerR family transcriptional regulator, light-induced transcriptional regulator